MTECMFLGGRVMAISGVMLWQSGGQWFYVCSWVVEWWGSVA
jgi:hypothetical protein